FQTCALPISYNDQHIPETPPKSDGKKHHIGSALIGGVAGAIIATLTVVLLFTNQIISFDDSSSSQQEPSSQVANDQPVSINVSDEVDLSSDVEETSIVVVGVSRLKKSNIW